MFDGELSWLSDEPHGDAEVGSNNKEKDRLIITIGSNRRTNRHNLEKEYIRVSAEIAYHEIQCRYLCSFSGDMYSPQTGGCFSDIPYEKFQKLKEIKEELITRIRYKFKSCELIFDMDPPSDAEIDEAAKEFFTSKDLL